MSAASEPARARVELELVLGADPIRGEIRDPDGAWASFSGWLDLVGALERIAGPHRGEWGEGAGDRRGEAS